MNGIRMGRQQPKDQQQSFFAGMSVTEPCKVRTRETDEFKDHEATAILSASLAYDKAPESYSDAAGRRVPRL